MTNQYPLRVYNTLSKIKEPFQTVQPGKVGIYLCGPTVYKPCHIGHMVGPVIFDAIKRYLVYSGYQVKLVVNITDVDDKLIAESTKRGLTMAALAEEMIQDYQGNLRKMGIDTIDSFPRATAHIQNIIQFTQQLIDKGFAYAADGDVYFEVGRDGEYGKLSRRTQESLQGEGGSTGERKKAPGDFALWKSAKPNEPAWDSPWGKGRPGWHIECSVMSCRELGETFDIHGGGLDLLFPHHENEIAQSESCHGKPMARYWLHNGLMQAADEVGKVGGRTTREAAKDQGAAKDTGAASATVLADQAAQEAGKMGKSKGARPFSELLETFAPETIRFFLLNTHYRSPIQFSVDLIKSVENSLQAFYTFFRRYERLTGESFYRLPVNSSRVEGDRVSSEHPLLQAVIEHRRRFLAAMDDDFNTAGGMAELFEMLRGVNRWVEEQKLEATLPPQQVLSGEAGDVLKGAARIIRELTAVLGLFRTPPESKSGGSDDAIAGFMGLLIELRAEARAKKDFATADKIRKRLAEKGFVLEDRPTGTEWTRQ